MRLMRNLPELVTMVHGVTSASRAVGCALLMLALLIYVFAILMHTILSQEEIVTGKFNSLPLSMWTLLIDGTFMDSLGTVCLLIFQLSWPHAMVAWTCFMAFVLLSAMTVMNMLIGVLCEVVADVAATEREEQAIAMLKGSLLLMLKGLDADKSGELSREEFESVLHNNDAIGVLQAIDVDVSYLLELNGMHYSQDDDNNLTIPFIMEQILAVRGDRDATVKDIIDAHTFTRWSIQIALAEHRQEMTTILKSLLYCGGAK